MHKPQDNRTELRRKDREVQDQSWIKDVLRFEPYCSVATVADNHPFVRPYAFYYSESDHAIYIHGAHQGQNFDNLKKNNEVCLSIHVVGKMRGHTRAFEFFLEQAGVLVLGKASAVDDNQKKHTVMQALFEKYTPHLVADKDYEPANQAEVKQTTVYKIDITAWSGKLKWTDDNPLFRFDYEDVREKNRPKLPWNDDGVKKALTQEWELSKTPK